MTRVAVATLIAFFSLSTTGYAVETPPDPRAPVYMDSVGREWLNPGFWSIDPYHLQSYCDISTGVCSGVLETRLNSGELVSSFDFSGYMWASRDDVRDLFYEIGDLPEGSLDSYSYSDATNAGGKNFYKYFTSNDPGTSAIRSTTGFVRTWASEGRLYTPFVSTDHPSRSTGPSQTFHLLYSHPAWLDHFEPVDYTGSWMYKVPEPESITLGLIAMMGVLVFGFRRAIPKSQLR